MDARPDPKVVSELIEKHTFADQGRFNLLTFHDFMDEFSALLGVPIKTLATVITFVHCCRLVVESDRRPSAAAS